jgi:hypothetical protein
MKINNKTVTPLVALTLWIKAGLGELLVYRTGVGSSNPEMVENTNSNLPLVRLFSARIYLGVTGSLSWPVLRMINMRNSEKILSAWQENTNYEYIAHSCQCKIFYIAPVAAIGNDFHANSVPTMILFPGEDCSLEFIMKDR